MLWLNPTTGDVVEAPKRPSAAWLIVIEAKISGKTVQSTLEGLRIAILSDTDYSIRPQDIELDNKTELNIYSNEQIWKDLIEGADFPYLKTAIANDGTLEVRYDTNSKDAAPVNEGLSIENRMDDDDTPFKKGGQRGTGRSGPNGQPPNSPSDTPSDTPSDEPSDTPSDEPSDEPSNTPPDKIIEEEGEGDGRDAYEEGQKEADSISDKLKEKMKERMEGKGKPADESGEANQPAPDGSEGGAPAENPTGEGGQGTGQDGAPSQGDGGQGDSDSGSGQGDGDGDGDSDSEGDSDGDGDGDSSESGDGGEEDSQDGDSNGESDSEKDSNVEDGDSNSDENGEKGDESGDSSENGDSDDEDGEGQSDNPSLPSEDEEALNQLVEEAEDARDSAEQSMQEANTEEAKENAENARRASDEAREIVEENGQDADTNEKVQEAEEYADEAEEFAELAEELEEEINQLFDESGLEEDEFEEFKQGLLDELFGEDSEFGDALSEQEKRLLEKIERRSKMSRGTIRCVNWETGEIKSFPETETIGDTWIQITKFFSPFETADGAQIVVDRTIGGAVEMIIAISNKAPTGTGIFIEDANFVSATFKPFFMGDTWIQMQKSLIDALKNMRMFTVKSDDSKITISY